MDNLTEFQQRAAAAAVMKMLQGKNFSICDLDAIAKTIGREQSLAGRDYAALRSLHCVDWADMGPELARITREKGALVHDDRADALAGLANHFKKQLTIDAETQLQVAQKKAFLQMVRDPLGYNRYKQQTGRRGPVLGRHR